MAEYELEWGQGTTFLHQRSRGAQILRPPKHLNLLLWIRSFSFPFLHSPPTNSCPESKVVGKSSSYSSNLPNPGPGCLTLSNLPAFLRYLSQLISNKAPADVKNERCGARWKYTNTGTCPQEKQGSLSVLLCVCVCYPNFPESRYYFHNWKK